MHKYLFLLHIFSYFSFFFSYICGTANKKAKLITTNNGNNNNSTMINNNHNNNNQNGNVNSQQHSTKSYLPVDDQQQYYTQQQQQQQHHDITRPGSSNSSICGPKLVNKQLVLPFVPPSFPNNSPDGANHLIKPSEYLKSITDKKSNAGSSRYEFDVIFFDKFLHKESFTFRVTHIHISLD